jgi:hypothetical protein
LRGGWSQDSVPLLWLPGTRSFLCELRLTVLGKTLFAVVALLGLLLIGATIAADIVHGDEHADQIAAVDLLIAGGALVVVVVVDHVLQRSGAA